LSSTTNGGTSGEYVFDKGRRSSVDLSTMTGNLHDGSSNVEAQIQIVNPLLLFDNVDHAANNIGTDVSSSVSLTKQLQQQQCTGSVGSFTKLANFCTIDEEKDEIETVNGDDGDGGESDDIMEPVDSSNESS
jgi:hypothetical protein